MKHLLQKILSGFLAKWPLLVMATVIIMGSWAGLFIHYTQPEGSGGLISKLEAVLFDFRLKMRGFEKPKKKVVILAVDEKSIQQFGRWPFMRKVYPQVIENLKKSGVKWIAADIIFSERERATIGEAKAVFDSMRNLGSTRVESRIDETLKEIEKLEIVSNGDRAFGKSIESFENFILGYFYFLTKREVDESGLSERPFQGVESMEGSKIEAVIIPEGRELSSYKNVVAAGLMSNIPFLAEKTNHFAFFSNEADSDAIMRWLTLIKVLKDGVYPSLPLKLAAEAMNKEILVEFDSIGVKSIELIDREDEDVEPIRIPVDPNGSGRMLIKHRGPAVTFPQVSFADVYNGTLTDEQRKRLDGSLVMIGLTAIGINDIRPTPFDSTIDGVEVHANAVDNILSNDFMKRPKEIYTIELLLILIIGLLFTPILIFSRAAFSGFVVVVSLVGYYYFDKYYWFSNGVWAYMAMPILEILALYVSITLYKYIVEEREKRKVKGAFSLYLSPDVINEVLEEPDNLQLGGVRKELTVFFSDVRSFTTISEGLTPEQLCVFMNDYFTPMTSIILRSKGVLDKYIGDAIMAFWGAPIPLDDQADVAADSAIEMLDALDELQKVFAEKGFPYCDIGIGLNTGMMSVGNMGSDERFCYTVMGDAVNLGARLEGLTKEYGAKILLSEATVSRFRKKHHLVRDLDDIRVKGKNEPVKVYHQLRPTDLARESDIRELIGLFEEGRRCYREQSWDEARKYFDQCLALHSDDGAAKLYLDRIREYQQKSPGEDWDGVYTFTHK